MAKCRVSKKGRGNGHVNALTSKSQLSLNIYLCSVYNLSYCPSSETGSERNAMLFLPAKKCNRHR